jgi:sulfonate transport system substrate-binding protein
MNITRRSFLSGAASASVLSLAACGGGAAATNKSGRKKVRLTYSAIALQKARGVFEQSLNDQGIDVSWIGPFPNHAPTIQAVASDTADFSFGGSSTPAAQAILSGSTELVFAAWTPILPRSTSIIVLPSSGIKRVQDLVGKSIAVNKAGVAEFLLVAALEKYNVPRDKVNVVYLNPPDAAPAFANGKVDAWAIWFGPLEMAEVQHGAIRIFEEDKEIERPIDFGSFIVRKEYAQREPDTIRKVIAAYKADADWVRDHVSEAFTISNKVSKYPQAVVDKLIARGLDMRWSLMNDDGIAQLQHGIDWLSEHKILTARLDIAQHSVRL